MTTSRRGIATLILVLVAALTVGAQSRVTVSLGHSDEVSDLAGRDDEDVALSVADDGKLMVWDLEHRGLLRAWQVSVDPITRVAMHPRRTEAAIFVQTGLRTGLIVALNWETGEELFTVRVNARPTSLQYSPRGTYIVYAVSEFESLHFLDSETGRSRRFLDDGFGVVSFVQMARSEQNALTYVPSRGEFIYWQLRSGNELQTVQTQSRLEHVTLVDPDTQRFLAAASNEQLVIVDNLTGSVEATYPLTPIHDIAYDSETDRIVVLTERSGERSALAFRYERGRLRRESYRPQNLAEDTVTLRAAGSASRGFLAGAQSGEISFYDEDTGRRTVLGDAPTGMVTDLGFTSGSLHLAVGDTLVTISSDLFEPGNRDLAARYVRTSRNTLSAFPSLRFVVDGDRLLLWGSDEPGTLYELLPPERSPRVFYDDEQDVPITLVRTTAQGPVVVHRDGRIVQVDRASRVLRFRYNAVGAQDVGIGGDAGLIIAKTSSSQFDSSLIIVDQLTRETVALETEAFLVPRVAVDSESQTLYAVELHGRASEPEVRLTRFAGRNFSRTSTLRSRTGEYTTGDLLWDPETESLLSSMGNDAIRRYSGRREEVFPRTERLHRTLAVGGPFVAARNADGTVTLWDREGGEHVAEIYVVGTDWIASAPNGRYLTSSTAAERYLTFIPAARTRLEMSDFRLPVPLE
ncbi:MAG: WD40 repeat domain-containing protein [Spirochaetota bacterium]